MVNRHLASYISCSLLDMIAPEGGDFVELVLLYRCTKWLTDILLRVSAAVFLI